MELSTLISSTLRLGTPLLLAALGILISSKGGIVNMGMEGNMLFGAFIAAYITWLTNQPLLGLLLSIPAGIIYSLIMGAFIIKGRGDHVVCGLGMNFFIIGTTTVLLSVVWNSTGYSAEVPRLPHVQFPWLGQQSISLFISLILMVALWFFLERTNVGLRVCSVGEHPAAADSVGVDVVKYQFLSMAIAGALGGLAGAELSIGQMGYFVRQMSASKGFLAYSVVIFAGYNPFVTLLIAMFLGLLDAVQMRAQTMFNIPGQFLLILPYAVTLLSLVLVGNRKKPKAAGKTYIRGNF